MSHDDALSQLQRLLQSTPAAEFERLVAGLFGTLLDCNVFVSKSGFQFGADAGTSISGGINIRFECKRYSDGTSLDERELLGEIDQALQRDKFLEGWVLVTTRDVNEQLACSLLGKGEKLGVPVVIVDWQQTQEFPRLAALCTVDPTTVGRVVSPQAQRLVDEVREKAKPFLERLRREVQAWCIGYLSLQKVSHAHLRRIWTDVSFSRGMTGQNMAAGTNDQIRIRREGPHAAVSNWWNHSDPDIPLAIVGREGVGKTWTCVDWMIDNLSFLPVTLLVSSSYASGINDASDPDLLQLIAYQLYRQNQTQDIHYWMERAKRTLQRPASEGPAMLLYLDGLNERRNVQWSRCVQRLQLPESAGRVRLIVSTRPDHFRNDLKEGRVCFPQMTKLDVVSFDTGRGGELDQLLAKHSLSRDDLGPGLLEICANPRMFSLVLRLRSTLSNASEVTIQRVLWEYGRDELSARSDRAFSQDEWSAWLTSIAEKHRSGSPVRSLTSLEASVSRPILEPNEVYRRLSEIVDGQFAKLNAFGNITLSADLVEHALGLQLIAELSGIDNEDEEYLSELAHRFLEPLSGLSEYAAILRAATNIAICSESVSVSIQATVVSGWLQCQNLPDAHIEEILALATPLSQPLLRLIGQGRLRSNDRALSLSVAALRNAMELDARIQNEVLSAIASWFERIPLGLESRRRVNEGYATQQRKEIELRIGSATLGRRRVLGIDFLLSNDGDEQRLDLGIQLIQGISLSACRPIFERVAIMHAISPKPSIFHRLDWLCFLNEKDSRDANQMLRELARDLASRPSEEGVHEQLPAKCAEILFLLSTDEDDAIAAKEVRPTLGNRWDYETDYLSDPLRSFFALERRHVLQVLSNESAPIIGRLRRTKGFFVDPTIQLPESFVAQMETAAHELDTTQVDSGIGQTESDTVFDMCLPAIAAATPDSLKSLVNRRLADINGSDDKSLYWRVMRSVQCFIAIDDSLLSYEGLYAVSSSFEAKELWLTQSHLLFHELFNLAGVEQCSKLLQSDLDGILNDFQHVVRELSREDADELIQAFGSGEPKQRLHLLVLLSFSATELSESAIAWTFGEAFGDCENNRNLAFLVLARLATEEFGRRLWDSNWKWERALPIYQSDCGSLALIRGSDSVAFEDLVFRIAPGFLLHAVRKRGAHSAEVGIVMEILRSILEFSPTLTGFELSFDIQIPQVPGEGVRSSLDYGNEFLENPGELSDRTIGEMNARRREANAKFREYIKETQGKGGDLLLSPINPKDVEACLVRNLGLVEVLLEGLPELSVQFRERVRRAEFLYLALCEGLMRNQPAVGCKLWRALQEIVLTRYIGAAEVNELLHILFRAPASPEVSMLRTELLELGLCNTDKQLFEIALAAQYNGAGDWLLSQIDKDRSSGIAWKLRRSYVLEAFTVKNPMTLEDAWPSEQLHSELAELRRWSARRRVQEAFSRHWWEGFVSSTDLITAYRSWILFLEASDRRAYLFIRDANKALAGASELNRRKWAHLMLNKHNMKRAFEEKEKKLDERFLHRDIAKEIHPWGSAWN